MGAAVSLASPRYSRSNPKECIITREVIANKERPNLISEPKEQSA